MASHCEICGSEYGFNPRGYMECDRCGDFNPDLGYSIANPDIQIRLSGWIRDQNRLGDQPTITPDVISRVGKMAIPGLRRRADNLLREIAKLLPGYTGIIRPNSVYDSPASQAITYSRNSEEVVVVINLLQHLDYIAIDGNRLRLTPNGILAIEEMAATGSEYAQVFVAMSFSPDLNES